MDVIAVGVVTNLLPVARSWQAAFMLNNDHEDLLIMQQPIAGSQVAAEVVPGRSEWYSMAPVPEQTCCSRAARQTMTSSRGNK